MTQTNSKQQRILFRTTAVLAGLLPFVALELLLVVIDAGNPQRHVDPLVGFSKIHPLFELNDDDTTYQTAKSREINFGRQSFTRLKPENGFRAFCLGGSTVRGRPYQVDTAFAKWAELELNLRDPSNQFEFINCGGLSYASYRLLPILDEVLQYDPDLIVIATGHNEFLEDRTYGKIKSQSSTSRWLNERVYSLRTITLARGLLHDADKTEERTILPEDVDPKLDSESGYESYRRDEEWKTSVAQHFRQSLATMIERCHQANVPVVLMRLGMNLRDCPPFKSEINEALDASSQRKFVDTMSAAKQQESESAEAALALYRRAELIDPSHPLLCFRIARCLDRTGQLEEAADYYLKAKDLDICPLRMTESVSAHIVEVANQTKTPIVDARNAMEENSADEIPGQDWFVDHVHPSIRGHQLMASLLIDKLADKSIVSLSDISDNVWRRAVSKHLTSLGVNYRANGGRRVGWLEHWARRAKLFEDTLPQTSHGYLHQGNKRLGFGDVAGAVGAYKMAVRSDAAHIASLIAEAKSRYENGECDLSLTLLRQMTEFELTTEQTTEVTMAEIVVLMELERIEQARSVYVQNRHVIDRNELTQTGWAVEYSKVAKSLAKPIPGS